jgi:hypothetical protein
MLRSNKRASTGFGRADLSNANRVDRTAALGALAFLCSLPAMAATEPAVETACDSESARSAASVGHADLLMPPYVDHPTPVRVGIYVEDLRDIDAVSSSYRLIGMLTEIWCDPRLAFDPVAEGAEQRIFSGPEAESESERIFTPQAFPVNQLDGIDIMERVLRVRYDGTVIRDLTVGVLLAAKFDLRRFPFDRQSLEVEIESFEWNAEQLVFVEDTAVMGFSEEFEPPEWEIVGVRAEEKAVDAVRSSRPVSRLTLAIDIKREPGFYLWKVLLPLVLIVALSWSIFWMVDERFGARVRISATGILTIVAYQFVAGQNLPRVNYLTLIDKMMVGSFLLLAITVLESYVVSRYAGDDRERALKIDRAARWVFPLAYAVLILLVFFTTPG